MRSPNETIELGRAYGAQLKPGAIIALFGELGSGKTTFTKGIAEGVLGYAPEDISSPTFSYLNIYQGMIPLYHFDLYRLKDEQHFLDMGFDEYLFSEGVSCIEWSERIESILPKNAVRLYFSHENEHVRGVLEKR